MKKNNKVTTKNGGWKALALALAVVLTAGAALAVLEFASPYKPSRGFKPAQIETGNNDDFVSDNLVVNAGEGYGISVMAAKISEEDYEEYGVDTQALNAVAFQFSLNEGATIQTLDTALSFKDESSSWADGKAVSDYITVSVNDLRVTATCKEAFGEQIILKVSSVDNPSCFIDLTLDYVKPVTSGSVQVRRGNGENVTTYITTITAGDNKTYTPHIVASYGVGTITPTITITEGKIAICKSTNGAHQSLYYISALAYRAKGEKEYSFGSSFVCDSNFLLNFAEYDSGIETVVNNEMIKICTDIYCQQGCMSPFVMTVTYSVTYGGETISAPKTAQTNVLCETQNLKIGVTDISSDKNGAVFY